MKCPRCGTQNTMCTGGVHTAVICDEVGYLTDWTCLTHLGGCGFEFLGTTNTYPKFPTSQSSQSKRISQEIYCERCCISSLKLGIKTGCESCPIKEKIDRIDKKVCEIREFACALNECGYKISRITTD